MQDLTITFIQSNIIWEDIDANLDIFTKKISSLDQKTDLILLPEMFNTGFTNNRSALFEEMDGKTIKWMCEMADKSGAVIAGSMIIKEKKGFFYNRLVCMYPGGTYKTYDKRHLFRMMNEDNYFKSGRKRLIAQIKGWRICPMICYDLRFPVWCRNLINQGLPDYDLLIFLANWPEKRRFAWQSLLTARAIENQSYVVGVNRIGNDNSGLSFSGDSAVIAPDGIVINDNMVSNDENIETITLLWSRLEKSRNTFPVFLDSDRFQIID